MRHPKIASRWIICGVSIPVTWAARYTGTVRNERPGALSE